jgi:hypothetical protein
MTDDDKALVERLRSVDVSWSETGEWCAEAADRIEALSAEIERLRGALRGIDEHCQTGLNSEHPHHWEAALQDVMDTARAALGEQQ